MSIVTLRIDDQRLTKYVPEKKKEGINDCCYDYCCSCEYKKGSTGNTGPRGFQGDTGPHGFQGLIGFQGFVGFQGNQGFQGNTGSIGSQGNNGFQGVTGPIGFQGNQGFQGDTGNTGATGIPGQTGPAGTNTGFTGQTGATGPNNISGSGAGLTMFNSGGVVTATISYVRFGSSTFTENFAQIVAPKNGFITNLAVILSAAPSGASTRTLAIRVNEITTPLSVTITGGATGGINTSSIIAVNQLDLISLISSGVANPTLVNANVIASVNIIN